MQMISGRKIAAGATLTLPAVLLAGLLGSGALLLAKLPLPSLLALSLVPVGARLPVPPRAPLWLQAVLLSLYASIIAAVACVLAWHA